MLRRLQIWVLIGRPSYQVVYIYTWIVIHIAIAIQLSICSSNRATPNMGIDWSGSVAFDDDIDGYTYSRSYTTIYMLYTSMEAPSRSPTFLQTRCRSVMTCQQVVAAWSPGNCPLCCNLSKEKKVVRLLAESAHCNGQFVQILYWDSCINRAASAKGA